MKVPLFLHCAKFRVVHGNSNAHPRKSQAVALTASHGYCTKAGTRFWIVTGADRGATMVLLPDEY
jgi:hypothetical protein